LLSKPKNPHADVNVMQKIQHKNEHGIYFGEFLALKKDHKLLPGILKKFTEKPCVATP
jgi:hypothetical protein